MQRTRNARKKPADPKTPVSGGIDQVEQRATDQARKKGQSSASDQEREAAYHEMNKTAPKVSERKSPAH